MAIPIFTIYFDNNNKKNNRKEYKIIYEELNYFN